MSTLDGKYIHGVKLTFVDWGPAYDSSYPNQTIKLFHMNLNSGNWSWFKDPPSEGGAGTNTVEPDFVHNTTGDYKLNLTTVKNNFTVNRYIYLF
jgi:hypothetical protein